MNELNNDLRKKFVEHVYKKLKERFTGSALDFSEGDKPQTKFFVGTLCSQEPDSSLGSIRTKVAPVRMGTEFLLKKIEAKNAKLIIKPKASVFYRIYPSLNQQLDVTMKDNKLDKEGIMKKINEQIELAKEGKEDSSLWSQPYKIFKKYRLKEIAINFPVSNALSDGFNGEMELTDVQEMIDDANEAYKTDTDFFRPKKTKKEERGIPLSALVNEESFNNFLQQHKLEGRGLKPFWKFKILVKISDFDKENIKVSVIFENTCKEKENEYIDNFLFDTHLRVEVDGAQIQDFIIDYLEDHYRYDGNIEASGINCETKKDKQANAVFTEHMPFFKQYRIKNNSAIKPRFRDLGSEKGIENLKEISRAMKEYLAETYMDGQKNKNLKSDEGRKKFQEDANIFKNEIARFDYGIELLEKYPIALKAFRLMNETFACAGESKIAEKPYDSWRIFQIIFIVMNVPDVLSTEFEEICSNFEKVEVLYFPTGGGKTETYLGLAIFTLFFDRLRGKKFGVSAITKFPLRLLSLQQIQRIANILAQAEIVRRRESPINGSDYEGFSLGYFVGDRNTPNKLISKSSIFGGEDIDVLSPVIEEREEIKKGNLKLESENLVSRKYMIVSKCPFCGSKKIMIDADTQQIRLLHRCMNEECNEILPIYLSDVEIYRYLPSFIISTLDKISVCGLQKNFRNIFGQVTGRCPDHGYTNSSECTEKGLCRVDKIKFIKVNPYDPVPTLQIQDEMHLVRESFGTFNSHYETFLEQFERALTNGKRSIKIIAATATISEYKLQANHLYCKESTQFPSQGPNVLESFYAGVDKEDLNRLIVGITPHYKTIIFSVVEILKSYHEIVNSYLENPISLLSELDLGITEEQVKELLEPYKLKLSYHLAKNNGDSISNSVRTMINPALRKKEIKEIRQCSLTGDVSFNDVRLALENIERPQANGGNIDLIIATSMISHGVDLDKMNFMVFQGMPTNTAEYIQASSRVGRTYPGMVFILFNPTRERDQSYFKFFSKFHEYKDLLVEAVPINRWAKFSVNRTLPGIFTASILNYFDIKTTPILGKSINMSQVFRKAIQEGAIKKEEIIDFILKSYKVDKAGLEFGFNEVIKEKTENFIYEISQSLGNEFITKPMSEKPMTSLRDVDELIDVNLATTDSWQILKDIKAGRTNTEDNEEGEEVSE